MTDVEATHLQEAMSLIDRMRSGEAGDAELSEITERLDSMLPDPNWFDYTIDRVPEMSPREIVEKAFSYRPIVL